MGFFSSLKKMWSKDKSDDVSHDKSELKLEESSAVVSEKNEEVASATNSDSLVDGNTKIDDEELGQTLGVLLRQAEPKLSNWLEITLDGVETVGDKLWRRLYFLLTSLSAPEDEANKFVSDFKAWSERMEYHYVIDFKSELQYRLALALELEDEDDEQDRIFKALNTGLAQTREKLGLGLQAIFASHTDLNAQFWDELEELFIRSDIGVESAMELISRLRKEAGISGATTPEEFMPIFEAELVEIFKTHPKIAVTNPPEIVLMIGVNGVGKTTTIAKLAYRAHMQGKKTLLVAADTFRAAAVSQLGVWAERTNSDFFAKKEGTEPAAVVFEAMDKALESDYDLIIVDTAGRLHTKTNLMDELKKVRGIISRKYGTDAPHRTILIVDATTGQNAISQAKMFKEQCDVDEIILTKLDGTAKGGIAIAISMQLNIPITFIGLGEKMEDLRPFNGKDFAKAILQY